MSTRTPVIIKPPPIRPHHAVQPVRNSRGWLAAWSLAQREVVRFLRQRNRIFGALGQPIVFLLLFGAGLSRSFSDPVVPGMTYAQYFYPGTLVLMVLFTAIFATISVIEDRTQGFLQSVLVSPAPAWSIAAGKILGATSLAMLQGLILLLASPLLGIPFQVAGWLGAIMVMALIGIGMSAIGLCFAWRMDSVQGYHAVMNVVLIPMWLLSGAMFPAAGASSWMRIVMTVNPLTYGTAALRQMLYLGQPEMTAGLPPMTLTMPMLTLFATAACAFAVWIVSRPQK